LITAQSGIITTRTHSLETLTIQAALASGPRQWPKKAADTESDADLPKACSRLEAEVEKLKSPQKSRLHGRQISMLLLGAAQETKWRWGPGAGRQT